MESFDKLKESTKEIFLLHTSLEILRWDLQTYMPPKALKQRTEQQAYLGLLLHRMATDSKRISLVEKLEADDSVLDQDQKREVYLARDWLNLSQNVPEDIVEAESKQRVVATRSWKKAKETNNWKLFESDLVPLFDICRRKGEYRMKSIGASSPYDALMYSFEPKMTSELITKVFANLRRQLVPLVKTYTERCRDIRIDLISWKVPYEIQRKITTELTGLVGYDTTSDNAGGRIDEAEHPFSTGYFDDVRMTVKYTENEFIRAVFGSLHEAGHSLYTQNRNPKWKWMALGEKCSSGVSESQARFVENIIGRSPEFWQHYYPRFQEITKDIFNDITLEEFVQAINIVRPSKIRVLADEMTYSLHVIIRFEIEQDLFNDKIMVSEIPEVWREKYSDYLGVTVENDTEGALQDTHWAWGYWGYFPNYCLGNLYTGMMYEQMSKDIPNWKNEVAEGDMNVPIGWLKEKVHRMSNRFDPSDLIERICGKPLTEKPFIKYLKEKYSTMYN